jgi:hypothetical protein
LNILILTFDNEIPWDFGGVFTPTGSSMKNAMGEKFLWVFAHIGENISQTFSTCEFFSYLLNMGESLLLTVSYFFPLHSQNNTCKILPSFYLKCEIPLY